MLVEHIDGHRDRFGVEPICQVLRDTDVQIAPSTYYAVKARLPSARAFRDSELTWDIRVVHKANLGVYGARKVHAALNREGISVARCTVERLMWAQGLQGIRRDKTRKTTFGEGAETDRPADLVKRAFTAPAPNQLWVADLTYIRTHAGWTYAAFVIDVFSRRVVGWQVSTSLRTDLALRRPRDGLMGTPPSRSGHHRTDPSQRCRSPVSSDSLQPSGLPKPLPSGPSATATTMRLPRRSTRYSKPSASATR